jgi:threonine dehydrogenase-like Zn-dependent dehydrogenase
MAVRSEFRIVFPSEQKAELAACERDVKPLEALEIVGRTLYTLVSPGTELNVYLGHYAKMPGMTWGKFPFVPGYAAAFVAEAVGSDVKDVKPGDLLYCMGQHQTYQRVKREQVLPVPKDLAAEKVPFARLMNVTMSTLTTTVARPPAKVLVTGLGPIGLMGALIFARSGYDVIACDPIAERQAVARSCGLTQVHGNVPVDDPTVKGQVALVVECSAHEQAVLDGCAVVHKGGEVVLVGVPMVRRTEIYAQELMNRVFRNMVVLRSGSEWQVTRYPADYRPNSIFGNMAAALRWLAEGSIRVDPVYEVIAPTDPQAIYQDALNRRSKKLAQVLDWTKVG